MIGSNNDDAVAKWLLKTQMCSRKPDIMLIRIEFLKGIRYNRMRVEYRNQARLGDVMIPVVYEKENAGIVALCDMEKKPYAVVEAKIE